MEKIDIGSNWEDEVVLNDSQKPRRAKIPVRLDDLDKLYGTLPTPRPIQSLVGGSAAFRTACQGRRAAQGYSPFAASGNRLVRPHPPSCCRCRSSPPGIEKKKEVTEKRGDKNIKTRREQSTPPRSSARFVLDTLLRLRSIDLVLFLPFCPHPFFFPFFFTPGGEDRRRQLGGGSDIKRLPEAA